MSISTTTSKITIPTLFQSELMSAAHALGRAHQHFNAAAPGNPDTARALLTSLADWFDAMLPAATGEIKKALVELCVMEIARAHLEHQADAGKLGSAKIVDVNAMSAPKPPKEHSKTAGPKLVTPAASKSLRKRDKK